MALRVSRTPWKLSYLPRSHGTGAGDEEWGRKLGRLMEGLRLDGLMGHDQASGVEVVQGWRWVMA